MASFSTLWQNHPSRFEFPCDQAKYENQCAIRMGVAFQRSKVNLSTCRAVKCDYHLNEHKAEKHYLRAQELATWLKNNSVFGKTEIKSRAELRALGGRAHYKNRKGIIFIEDGWGPTDHIDLWDGQVIKNGSLDYFDKGIKIWFWDIL